MKEALIIFRGLPGAGKSSIGKSFAKSNDCVFIEPDMYITDDSGNYNYSVEHFKIAVNQAKDDIKIAMQKRKKGYDVTVVYADVLPSKKEVMDIISCIPKTETYIVIDIVISMRESFLRNVHGVPWNELRRMCNEWENWYE